MRFRYLIFVASIKAMELSTHHRQLQKLRPNTCVYRALEKLLPKCESNIETSDRVRYAVELSNCEYEAIGVPLLCPVNMDYIQCARMMESHAQWWTTYSGYYQTISTICAENAHLSKGAWFVELFTNISKVHSEASNNLQNVGMLLKQQYEEDHMLYSQLFKEFESTLENIASDFEQNVIEKGVDQFEAAKTNAMEAYTHHEKYGDMIYSKLNTFMEILIQHEEIYANLNVKTDHLVSSLQIISPRLSDIEQRVDLIDAISINVTQNMGFISSQMDSITALVNDLKSLASWITALRDRYFVGCRSFILGFCLKTLSIVLLTVPLIKHLTTFLRIVVWIIILVIIVSVMSSSTCLLFVICARLFIERRHSSKKNAFLDY